MGCAGDKLSRFAVIPAKAGISFLWVGMKKAGSQLTLGRRCKVTLAHCQDEVLHLGVDLLFPFSAREQAVVAHTGLEMVALEVGAEV